jgi:hypothetical protein
MNEKELELLLSSKMKSCVAGRRLSGGFADRVVSEVRRTKRVRRFRVVTLSVLVIVSSSALMGLLAESPGKVKGPKEMSLVAARENGTKEKVMSWIFLGFFKECIKRNRTNKRKEEY